MDENQFASLLGHAVLNLWPGLPREVQEHLFSTAVDDAVIANSLAELLHDRRPKTAHPPNRRASHEALTSQCWLKDLPYLEVGGRFWTMNSYAFATACERRRSAITRWNIRMVGVFQVRTPCEGLGHESSLLERQE
jgi:hypothetical protein